MNMQEGVRGSEGRDQAGMEILKYSLSLTMSTGLETKSGENKLRGCHSYRRRRNRVTGAA